MRELSMEEVGQVNGGFFEGAAPYFTAAIGIGVATFGTSWGALPVIAAVTFAPVAVGTMAGLSFLGGVALATR